VDDISNSIIRLYRNWRCYLWRA